MHRLLAAGTIVIALACSAATAQAAKPVKGSWTGKQTTFTVNPAGTRITKFFPGGCASAGILYPTFKVKADGSFGMKTRASVEGGRSQKLTVSGKFTSTTTAKGTVRYGGRCTVKFKVTADTLPTPPAAPTPTDPNPDPATPGY